MVRISNRVRVFGSESSRPCGFSESGAMGGDKSSRSQGFVSRGGLAPRWRWYFRPQDREGRQRGKWPQMESLPWTQEWVVLSPGCRRARFLPKSDPAAPFFVLHRPAQRMGRSALGTRFFVHVCVQGACCKGATKESWRCCQRAAKVPDACRQGAANVAKAAIVCQRAVMVP